MAAECYGLFSDDNSHQVGAAPAIYNSSLCIDYFSGKEALTKVRDYCLFRQHGTRMHRPSPPPGGGRQRGRAGPGGPFNARAPRRQDAESFFRLGGLAALFRFGIGIEIPFLSVESPKSVVQFFYFAPVAPDRGKST